MDVDSFDVRGEAVAVDGSCTRCPIRGMARAAWAQAFMGDDDQIHQIVRGPVTRALPQTPQAGEQVAMAQLSQFMRRRTEVHADCSTSIGLANKPWRDQLSARNMYAGCRKWAMNQPGHKHLAAAFHVKAHMTKEQIDKLPPAARRVALANKAADEAAKAAVLLHPQPSGEVLKDIERDVNRLRIVYRVAAKLLPCFPKEKFERVPKAPGRCHRRKLQLHGQWHDWSPCNDRVWRCTHCLIMREAASKDELEVQGCKGRPALLAHCHASHGPLAFPEVAIDSTLTEPYRGKPLLVCLTCGRYGQQRLRLLREPCGGRPEPASAGAKVLRRLGLGLHPREAGKPEPLQQGTQALASTQPAAPPPKLLAPKGQPATALAQGAPGGRLQLFRERVRLRLAAQPEP